MSLKKHIVETMKRLYTNKLISVRDGNVSFKPKNEKYFYISAGQVKKNEINEDQIIKIDFKRKDIIRNKLDLFDLNYNKDTFVVHAHPPNITAFMGILNSSNELNTIKDYFPEINVGKIGRNVRYLEAGSLNLAAQSYVNLKNNDIIGLERHGTLSIGNDIDKIFEDIETLEYYIDIYFKS